MIYLYESGFRVENNLEYNAFIRRILFIGESYLKFLISKNKLYLPSHIEPKDAAIDLLAEIFTLENNILIKFRDFFENNFPKDQIQSEKGLETYLRGFVYTVIRNNLINIYRDNDPETYNIYRNIKEAVKSLNYCTTIHFSDKYVHSVPTHISINPIPEKEDLFSLVYTKGLTKEVNDTKRFIELLFIELDSDGRFSSLVRMSDLAGVIKSILASNLTFRSNGRLIDDQLGERINIKYMLERAQHTYIEILNIYAVKNKLPKNFLNSMYNLIEEVMQDLFEGNKRKSVFELQKLHFKSEDKILFNKVQYCLELFEDEITKQLKREQKFIG